MAHSRPTSLPPPSAAAPAREATPAAGLPPESPRPDQAGNAYRILVVEDDQSQAVFAEAILRGAGMVTEVVTVPEHAMQALERFQPDLVLMDLHMPGTSGTELTARIRADVRFMHMPVVFLTGDSDPDRKVEALENGGDDFIVKPVRPRHLIAAIQNRAGRARALAARWQAAASAPDSDPQSREALMRALDTRLQTRAGGALLVEIANAPKLRDRYGFARFELLMAEAAALLRNLPGERMTARLGDHAFLVLLPGQHPRSLEDQARILRDGIGHHVFGVNGESLRLRCSVGFAALEAGFTDAAQVLAALEEAARIARGTPTGMAAHVSPRSGVSIQLKQALAAAPADGNDCLYLAFQPVVAVQGNGDALFQVLVRMRDGNGNAMHARDLLPAAHASGLLPELDRWVLHRALDRLRRQREQGQPLQLFVSQSADTLTRRDFAASLRQALDVEQADGHSLVLDVRLEDALVHSLLLEQTGAELAKSGVRLCLSQFRLGEDAEALLRRLPLAYVRLDVTFAAQPLPPSMRDELDRIIDAAHALGARVIAHAVEDPHAAAALWASGIDYLQGNLVHQPQQALDYDFGSGVP